MTRSPRPNWSGVFSFGRGEGMSGDLRGDWGGGMRWYWSGDDRAVAGRVWRLTAIGGRSVARNGRAGPGPTNIPRKESPYPTPKKFFPFFLPRFNPLELGLRRTIGGRWWGGWGFNSPLEYGEWEKYSTRWRWRSGRAPGDGEMGVGLLFLHTTVHGGWSALGKSSNAGCDVVGCRGKL